MGFQPGMIAPSQASVTIAGGGSVVTKLDGATIDTSSGPGIQLFGNTLCALIMPAAPTSGYLKIQGWDGTAWRDIYYDDGTLYVIRAAAAGYILLSGSDMIPLTNITFVECTAVGVASNQTGDFTFIALARSKA